MQELKKAKWKNCTKRAYSVITRDKEQQKITKSKRNR